MEAVNLARNPDPGATLFEVFFPVLDLHDPETNDEPAGSVAGARQAFLSNDLNGPAMAGDRIVRVAHGVIFTSTKP